MVKSDVDRVGEAQEAVACVSCNSDDSSSYLLASPARSYAIVVFVDVSLAMTEADKIGNDI